MNEQDHQAEELRNQLLKARWHLALALDSAQIDPPTSKSLFLAQLQTTVAEDALSKAKLAETTISTSDHGRVRP